MSDDNRPTILIVDDLPENLLTLQSMLEDLPIDITTSSSGDDTLKILLKKDIDLILLDICMPIIDGIGVAKLLKGIKRTKDIPIIFISGSKESNYLEFKKIYPDNVDFMLKPVDYNALRDKVKRIVNLL